MGTLTSVNAMIATYYKTQKMPSHNKMHNSVYNARRAGIF